jgi:phage tail P2-like protein
MSSHLLPPSATEQERAISLATARLGDVPTGARQAWNPDTCPVELLPWLAWAFSVDEWDPNWTEAEKRGVINNSFFVHRHKGTIGAIRRALEPLGYLIDVVEWWETTPKGEPYTFSIVMGTGSKPVTPDLYDKVERIVLTYKNLRSHLRNLTVKTEIRGKSFAGALLQDGNETTVYPYNISEIQSVGHAVTGIIVQDATTVTIYPDSYEQDAAGYLASSQELWNVANITLPGMLN